MIIRGIDTQAISRVVLVDNTGSLVISAAQLTNTGGKFHLNAGGDLYVTSEENTYFNPVGGVATLTNSALPAGASQQNIVTVTASQRWQIDAFGVYYAGTVATVLLYPDVTISGTTYYLDTIVTPVSGKFYTVYPNLLLEAGAVIGCQVNNATLNDDFIGTVFYRRVK